MNEAEMKALIDKLVTWFQSFFKKPYVPPPYIPEPVEPPIVEPPIVEPEPSIKAPVILSMEVLDSNSLVSINYDSETPVNVVTSDGEGLTRSGSDAETPLNIAVGTGLAEGWNTQGGEFTGRLVITLSNEGGSTTEERFIVPKPIEPETPIVRPPTVSEPEFIREINLTSINSNIKKATHPSLRSVQLLNNDALVSFESAGHVFSVKQGRFVGQMATSGGADKTEFSPNYYGDYYYNKNGGLVRKNLFDSSRTKNLFSLDDARKQFNLPFHDVVSGPHEHNLVNDDLIAMFRAPINNEHYVFRFDVQNETFLGEVQSFRQRNGEPDFCGMAGSNFVVKNVKQSTPNWNDPFDFYPIAGEPFTADRKGMNHSCFDGKFFVSTARWRMDAQGVTTPINVPLDTAEHVGRVHGLYGYCVANDKQGRVYFFNSFTSEFHVIATDCKQQGYPVAFVLDGLLHLVIATNSGVYLRTFQI